MVDHKLVVYIENAQRKGLSIKQTEEKLIQSGYDKKAVEEAASKVRQKKFETVGLVVLGIIVAVGILGLVLDKFYQPVEQEPVSSFNLLKDVIEQGDISACDEFSPLKKELCIKSITAGDEGLQPNVPKEESIIEQAALIQDPTLCEGILSVVQKERCLILSGGKQAGDNIVYYENESNTSYETVNTQYNVFEQITKQAIAEHNPALCEQITNSVKKQRCILKSS